MNLEIQDGGDAAVILTPDQRLRVFVSSTLQELLDERIAVRSGIEALGLAPVMFEQGARPYPPRQLYRAYLAQSHVFVGLYWQNYGWIAPDEAVSGLEDEYQLSGDLPKLIYVKKAKDRDERLKGLLERIRDDDHVSYKTFASVRELRALLKNDLALLLSERFTVRNAPPPEKPHAASRDELPWPPTPMIGREHDRDNLVRLILRADVRLVTLTGTGGIGKTRLALDLAHRLKGEFADGVYFVALAAISDPDLVANTVARSIGAFEVEGRSALDACKAALREQRALLVLDNFEQVLGATSVIAELLAALPALKVLVTSRTPLNLSGEWDYPIPPLSLPNRDATTSLPALSAFEAVNLFVARARSVRPDFALTQENAADIAAITWRLEGLPLAIELAAARMRVMSAPTLLARLENRLDLLTGGYSDLPQRQRTLRDTIDWSFNLLTPDERQFFICLGVFVGGFSLEAVKAVCADKSDDDVFELIQSLADKSLVTLSDDDQRFGMLETVREFAGEKLVARGHENELRQKHADHFLSLVEKASVLMHGSDQLHWLSVVERDYTNIRGAIDWLLNKGDLETVSRFGSALWYFWYVRGHTSEGLAWMERALAGAHSRFSKARILLAASVMLGRQGQHEKSLDYVEQSLPILCEMNESEMRIFAHVTEAFAASGLSQPARVRTALNESLALAESSRMDWIIPYILANLARLEVSIGAYDKALEFAEQAQSRQLAVGDPSIAAFALISLATIRLIRREPDLAAGHFSEGFKFARTTDNPNLTASSLEGLFAVAEMRGQHANAARLWGMAQRLRETVSVPLLPMEDRLYTPMVADARLALGDTAFTSALGEGRTMNVGHALELISTQAA